MQPSQNWTGSHQAGYPVLQEGDRMTVEQLVETIAGIYTDRMQEALDKARKNIKNGSWDLGTLVKNATWSAYCDGLEEALRIVDECTTAGLKELAAKRDSQASPGAPGR